MNKKTASILSAICAAGMAFSFAGCGNGGVPAHEHTFFDIESIAATCVSEGVKAYKECLYCREKQLDGKKVSDEDLIVPVNPENHTKLVQVEAAEQKCVLQGHVAHSECDDCGAYVIDGHNVPESEVFTGNKGGHVWKESGLECSVCGATKHYYNGNEYVIGEENYHPIQVFTEEGRSPGYLSGNRPDNVQYNFDHLMEFGAQVANVDNQPLKSENGNYYITNVNSSNVNSFTRFAYGKKASYVGRFLMTYDFSVDTDLTGTQLQRIGVQVVNSNATAIDTDNQSKLIGNNSAANPIATTLSKDTVYSFAYVLELTSEQQLVQIFNCISAAQTATISNMHFINLDEEPTGVPAARLLYFGEKSNEKSNYLLKVEDCDHKFAYDVAAKEATCLDEGVIAHTHCPVCGKNKTDGEFETGGEFDLPLGGHTLGEEWQTDEIGHWKICSVCEEKVEEAVHVPGPEATLSDPQTCTVCGYVLADPLCHHEVTFVPATASTSCTEFGNIAHYHCSNCNNDFADANGKEILSSVNSPKNPLHDFTSGDTCANGCGTSRIEQVISVADPSTAFGTTAATVNGKLIENPGTWVCQNTKSSRTTAVIEDGVMKITVKENATENYNKAFVRFIPAKEDGTAFVGVYELSFDLTVTAKTGTAEDLTLLMGFDIQSLEDDVTGTVAVADASKALEIGHTYHITLIVETVTANQFVQLNLRNTVNCGVSLELSNAKIVLNSTDYSTGANSLSAEGI